MTLCLFAVLSLGEVMTTIKMSDRLSAQLENFRSTFEGSQVTDRRRLDWEDNGRCYFDDDDDDGSPDYNCHRCYCNYCWNPYGLYYYCCGTCGVYFWYWGWIFIMFGLCFLIFIPFAVFHEPTRTRVVRVKTWTSGRFSSAPANNVQMQPAPVATPPAVPVAMPVPVATPV